MSFTGLPIGAAVSNQNTVSGTFTAGDLLSTNVSGATPNIIDSGVPSIWINQPVGSTGAPQFSALGIGNTSAVTGGIIFPAAVNNRKLDLYPVPTAGGNDFTSYSIGVAAGIMRFCLGATTASYAYLAGISGTSGNTLMTLAGTGSGIALPTPATQINYGMVLGTGSTGCNFNSVGVTGNFFTSTVPNDLIIRNFQSGTTGGALHLGVQGGAAQCVIRNTSVTNNVPVTNTSTLTTGLTGTFNGPVVATSVANDNTQTSMVAINSANTLTYRTLSSMPFTISNQGSNLNTTSTPTFAGLNLTASTATSGYYNGNGTCSIAAQTAMGAGATASIASSSQTGGVLTLTAGSSGTTTGLLAIITLPTATPVAVYGVHLTPGLGATAINAANIFFEVIDTTHWAIYASTTPFTPLQSCAFAWSLAM